MPHPQILLPTSETHFMSHQPTRSRTLHLTGMAKSHTPTNHIRTPLQIPLTSFTSQHQSYYLIPRKHSRNYSIRFTHTSSHLSASHTSSMVSSTRHGFPTPPTYLYSPLSKTAQYRNSMKSPGLLTFPTILPPDIYSCQDTKHSHSFMRTIPLLHNPLQTPYHACMEELALLEPNLLMLTLFPSLHHQHETQRHPAAVPYHTPA
jgi:hypothetical protein